ncbi:hypothetical protein B0H14DRAFT_2640912 [Mycena olivaceomarginata]|nr:hypothetical protein B0H14DRAFT_2640912 [Mycena olivaceomarginata]
MSTRLHAIRAAAAFTSLFALFSLYLFMASPGEAMNRITYLNIVTTHTAETTILNYGKYHLRKHASTQPQPHASTSRVRCAGCNGGESCKFNMLDGGRDFLNSDAGESNPAYLAVCRTQRPSAVLGLCTDIDTSYDSKLMQKEWYGMPDGNPTCQLNTLREGWENINSKRADAITKPKEMSRQGTKDGNAHCVFARGEANPNCQPALEADYHDTESGCCGVHKRSNSPQDHPSVEQRDKRTSPTRTRGDADDEFRVD